MIADERTFVTIYWLLVLSHRSSKSCVASFSRSTESSGDGITYRGLPGMKILKGHKRGRIIGDIAIHNRSLPTIIFSSEVIVRLRRFSVPVTGVNRKASRIFATSTVGVVSNNNDSDDARISRICGPLGPLLSAKSQRRSGNWNTLPLERSSTPT